MRSRPEARLAKRCGLLLSSSAHWFFSPAKCVTASSTWCLADQAATCFKNCDKGSVVVKSLLTPASAAVLSDAEGSTNLKCLDCSLRYASIARASCASVSKQAI